MLIFKGDVYRNHESLTFCAMHSAQRTTKRARRSELMHIISMPISSLGDRYRKSKCGEHRDLSYVRSGGQTRRLYIAGSSWIQVLSC